MAITSGYVILGDEKRNSLTARVVADEHAFYNIVYAGDGNDMLYGSTGKFMKMYKQYGVQLFGEGGNDEIRDSVGSDTLSGGTGNDYIVSASGKDVIDGGEDVDTLEIDGGGMLSSDTRSITGIERLVLGHGTYRIEDFDFAPFDEIETINAVKLIFTQPARIKDINFSNGDWEFFGSSSNDVFDVLHAARDLAIHGGDGNDKIIGSQKHNYLEGGGDNDRLTGGAASDTIAGGAGNDVMTGGDGNDHIRDNSGSNTIYGGEGNDGISALGGKNFIFGGGGNDTISLKNGTDIVHAGEGADSIVLKVGMSQDTGKWTVNGDSGDDTLTVQGNLANLDVDGVERLQLYGNSGKVIIAADVLNGFDRIDNVASHVLQLSDGGDFTWKAAVHEKYVSATLIGSAKQDRIDLTASHVTWRVDGGAGNDTITLGKTSDDLFDFNTITGGDGNDTLTGGSAMDILHGDSGKDVLIGSGGHDSFTGGSGKDTYVFTSARGQTVITDFQFQGASHDLIDLSAVKTLKGFENLISNHSQQSADGQLVLFFGQNVVVLDDITAKDLDASDFIF